MRLLARSITTRRFALVAVVAVVVGLSLAREPAASGARDDALAGGETSVVATSEPLEKASPRTEPWTDAWILAHTDVYLRDPAARRDAMAHSLSNHTNLYSTMRLASYGLGDTGWDVLPAWNPSSRTLDRDDLATLQRGESVAVDTAMDGRASPRVWDGECPTTMDGWVALGRRVFFRYPLRAEPAVELAFATGRAEALGLHHPDDDETTGLVAFNDLEGRSRVGITCALCHSARKDDTWVVGRARRSLDYGAMRLAYEHQRGPVDPSLVARMTSWGPGRADITEDNDQDPVSIPDLWNLRALGSLTQAATIVHDSPLALALRQETQLLHANGERARPPRELAWALAMFLYSLEAPQPETAPGAQARRGKVLFEAHCDRCHGDATGSGKPVLARRVGTDPALANGHARGTGLYRPAPLVDVAHAAPYLHNGDVATLQDLLNPTRLTAAFTDGLHGPGPVPGHAFGTQLPPNDRAALVAWLHTL